MMVHTYNPSLQEAKAEGCRVQGQPVQHSETQKLKTTTTTTTKENSFSGLVTF
jgi:hypothetical protein